MQVNFKSLSAVLAIALVLSAFSVAGAAAAPAGQDTQPPLVYAVTVSPSPAGLGETITVTAVVDDSSAGGSVTKSAKFSVDGGGYQSMQSTDNEFNTPAEGVFGSYTAQKLGNNEICVKAKDAAGNESEPACTDLTVESEISFGGFFEPVSNESNSVKAGRVVPLRWAMVDAENNPITDRSVFRGIYSYQVDCSSMKGDPSTAVQEVGRFNQTLVSTLTSGDWTALWRPQKAYADSCRMVYALFSDGSTSPHVFFRFK